MNIPALVLTAGLATRLRPLSLVRAKAALPVAGEPLVCRILRSLVQAGVTDVALNLHHLPHTITGLVGDGSRLGLRVRYSWESPVLGSAGGPRRALPLLGAPRALIVNGDTLTDAAIDALVADHERHHRQDGVLATLAVVPNTEPHKYRGLIVDEQGAVIGRSELGSSQPSWHFIGLQVVEAAAFATVPPNVPYETVATLYPELIAARPGSIRARAFEAEFLDIGTPADYLETSLLIAKREGTSTIGQRCTVGASAEVHGSVVWDDVVVEPGARVRECVVTDGVRVPSETSWHGVTLRTATDDLAPGEKRIGDLAVASL